MIEEEVVRAVERVPELAGKVYPLFVPKDVPMPFLVYVSDGGEEADALDGWLGSYETRMELHIVHSSYAALKKLTAAVMEEVKAIDTATVFIEDSPLEVYESEIDAYRKAVCLKLTYQEE